MAAMLEQGVIFGSGGTNSRDGEYIDGSIVNFHTQETPNGTREYFGWMGNRMLEASDNGANWAVVGVPGPVQQKEDTYLVNFTNVKALGSTYNLIKELTASDPAIGRLIEQGFVIVGANDGDLAAHAAVDQLADPVHNRVGALIFGTGVGGAVVTRDTSDPQIFRQLKLPFEIGHGVVGELPTESFENTYSGTAIALATGGTEAKDLPIGHPMWDKVGRGVGKLAVLVGVMTGTELVVPTGGVGVGGYDKYCAELDKFMAACQAIGSAPQRNLLPEIRRVPLHQAQEFEMFGAAGIIQDHLNPVESARAA
jgi:predicted NBD/HSP70 family sugar kinase